jgi:hypothetical protein
MGRTVDELLREIGAKDASEVRVAPVAVARSADPAVASRIAHETAGMWSARTPANPDARDEPTGKAIGVTEAEAHDLLGKGAHDGEVRLWEVEHDGRWTYVFSDKCDARELAGAPPGAPIAARDPDSVVVRLPDGSVPYAASLIREDRTARVLGSEAVDETKRRRRR